MQPITSRPPRLVRWANVAMRGVHLIAVVWLGAALLGAPVTVGPCAAAVVLSGGLLLALELIDKPATFFEASGLSMAVKLALVGWMAVDRTAPLAIFWIVIAWSAFFAHAPAAFRHARIFRKVSPS